MRVVSLSRLRRGLLLLGFGKEPDRAFVYRHRVGPRGWIERARTCPTSAPQSESPRPPGVQRPDRAHALSVRRFVARVSSSLSASNRRCTAVSDVLANGPDPDADAVGYAEAQVLPLRQLKLAEATLADAVGQLDSAYKSFSSTDGAKGTPAAVKVSAAEKAVNAICPDAAP